MNKTNIFLDLLQSFIKDYLPIAKGASSNTIRSYKYAFKLLFDFMKQAGTEPDEIRFEDFTTQVFEDFFKWLISVRNCSLSTKNQRHAALLSFSEYAQNHNFEAAVSFRSNLLKVPLKKAPKKLRSYFTTKEVSVLLSLPDLKRHFGFRNQVLLCVMYASGARAQEVCDLRVKDFEYNSNGLSTLILTGKGNKTRKVSISEKCSKLLLEYLNRNNLIDRKEKYIFSTLNHEKCSISCIEEIFKKYISEGRQLYPDLFLNNNYSPHSMRHSTASHMLEAGVPLVVIKNFLGHASLTSTQVYAELSQGAVDSAVKKWNSLWFPPDTEEFISDKDLLGFLKD